VPFALGRHLPFLHFFLPDLVFLHLPFLQVAHSSQVGLHFAAAAASSGSDSPRMPNVPPTSPRSVRRRLVSAMRVFTRASNRVLSTENSLRRDDA
jgi:hypothetical protein